ncbi:MAG: glycosyl transferase [Betaproteobacteria bacterium HGW-Betaproteobacteria-16]|nr:MAG: glycosyl transferase [Betaproteobacteria bacterium HGW-Betaproteobacteria-16]
MSICLSLVSHGQAALGNQFLGDLTRTQAVQQLIITSNVPEATPWAAMTRPATQLNNRQPLGFAANHNQAFAHCDQPFYCVANPDIRLPADPFPGLLARMQDPKVGLVAPLVLSPAGQIEDSARRFPTPGNLFRKAVGGDDGRYRFSPGDKEAARPVEWVAGMFLLFRADAFRDVGGFDDKFHLYYEDVDICARLWKAGWKVVLSPDVHVIHAAQRASRHHPRYMAWHATSMARYFIKHLGRLPHTFVDSGPSPD